MKRPAAAQDPAEAIGVPVKVVKLSSKETLQEMVPVAENLPPGWGDEDDDSESDCFEDAKEEIQNGEGESEENLTPAVDATPEAPDWSKQAWTAHGNQMVENIVFNRPVHVSIPCTGIDGCTRALQYWGLKIMPKNIYDLESGYSKLLAAHYGECGLQPNEYKLHLGKSEGDHIVIIITISITINIIILIIIIIRPERTKPDQNRSSQGR